MSEPRKNQPRIFFVPPRIRTQDIRRSKRLWYALVMEIFLSFSFFLWFESIQIWNIKFLVTYTEIFFIFIYRNNCIYYREIHRYTTIHITFSYIQKTKDVNVSICPNCTQVVPQVFLWVTSTVHTKLLYLGRYLVIFIFS